MMVHMTTVLLTGFQFFVAVEAHGVMKFPPPIQDSYGFFSKDMHAESNCVAGCTGATIRGPGTPLIKSVFNALQPPSYNCVCEYFTNNTYISGKPTIDKGNPLLTYWGPNFDNNTLRDTNLTDGTAGGSLEANRPWNAPGSAPVWDSCGVGGGNPFGCPGGTYVDGTGQTVVQSCPGGGYSGTNTGLFGPFSFPEYTKWTPGQIVPLDWQMWANHGGGYQWRMCKISSGTFSNSIGNHEFGPSGYAAFQASEECFQANPLSFADEHSFLVDTKHSGEKKVRVKAHDACDGTIPTGSCWRKNPIPACNTNGGGRVQIKEQWIDAYNAIKANKRLRNIKVRLYDPKKNKNKKMTLLEYASKKNHIADLMMPGLQEKISKMKVSKSTIKKWKKQMDKRYKFARKFFKKVEEVAPSCGTDGFMFDPPLVDNMPYGGYMADIGGSMLIRDNVKIPEGIDHGSHLLQLRWDCDEGPQVWTSCAYIQIDKGL